MFDVRAESYFLGTTSRASPKQPSQSPSVWAYAAPLRRGSRPVQALPDGSFPAWKSPTAAAPPDVMTVSRDLPREDHRNGL